MKRLKVDWGHFGRISIGKANRQLMAFVMVLSFCRQIFLRFFLGAGMANFLAGHVEAFTFFSGVSRRILYDNLRSAVIDRVGDAIRFHPELLKLSAHYHFEPRPVAVARGNEKGRVERAIRYIRDNFFAARTYSNIHDLNAQALTWCQGISADRLHPEDRRRTVREVFEDERPRLLSLPENPFPAEERVEVQVGKTPYARFDKNDYSVPHLRIRRTLVVLATLEKIRILDGNEVIAAHPRSFDAGLRIEDEKHLRDLTEQKRHAHQARGKDRLHHALLSADQLFKEAASLDGNLGALTSGLTRLLDSYGVVPLEHAIKKAIERKTPHLTAIREILDQRASASRSSSAHRGHAS